MSAFRASHLSRLLRVKDAQRLGVALRAGIFGEEKASVRPADQRSISPFGPGFGSDCGATFGSIGALRRIRMSPFGIITGAS